MWVWQIRLCYTHVCAFFREFGEFGAAKPDVVRLSEGASAAFGRLCVETYAHVCTMRFISQPPSGGCVLKPVLHAETSQPTYQPPSGGCVLKQCSAILLCQPLQSAAFGRLCVETHKYGKAK